MNNNIHICLVPFCTRSASLQFFLHLIFPPHRFLGFVLFFVAKWCCLRRSKKRSTMNICKKYGSSRFCVQFFCRFGFSIFKYLGTLLVPYIAPLKILAAIQARKLIERPAAHVYEPKVNYRMSKNSYISGVCALDVYRQRKGKNPLQKFNLTLRVRYETLRIFHVRSRTEGNGS